MKGIKNCEHHACPVMPLSAKLALSMLSKMGNSRDERNKKNVNIMPVQSCRRWQLNFISVLSKMGNSRDERNKKTMNIMPVGHAIAGSKFRHFSRVSHRV
jgi:hypothetical protein